MTRRDAMAHLLYLSLGLFSCRRAATRSPQFAAFSLREAQRHLRGGQPGGVISRLGGINRPLGVVHDRRGNDVIMAGEIRPDAGSIALDDFVAAIRALFVQGQWPLVSIDKKPETPATGKQRIRFEGVARSSFAAQ